jgi:hypothetical protein
MQLVCRYAAAPPVSAETAANLRESTAKSVTPGGHLGPITCVAVAPDGGSFFTVGDVQAAFS